MTDVWEVKFIEGDFYNIRDEAEALAAKGWEPVSYSVAVSGAYSRHFVMMKRKKLDK